jgi:hypothetical protein
MDLAQRLVLRRRLAESRRTAPLPAASSKEGGASFRLFSSVQRLCVELRRPRPDRGIATHVMCFECEADFLLWCEADPLKYSNPLLHAKLMRHGCDLLASRSPASPSA